MNSKKCFTKKAFVFSVLLFTMAGADLKIDTVMPRGKACDEIFKGRNGLRIKVECYNDSTKEFCELNKKNQRNGVCRYFSHSSKLKGYVEYKNGITEGRTIEWDTAGEVVYRSTNLKGNRFGLYEEWYTLANSKLPCSGGTFAVPCQDRNSEYLEVPGPLPTERRPKVVYHYNADGKQEGEQKEWWPNGNPKWVYFLKNGHIAEGTEYFLNGKPRLLHKRDTTKTAASEGYLYGKSFNPAGRVVSEFKDGNGVSIIFNAVPNPNTGRYSATWGKIAGGKLVDAKELDSTEVAKLIQR